MLPLERVPAVRRIETDRTDVFAIGITGEFTAGDAENLCGLLEGAFSLHDRIDLLVRLADLESVDLSDLSDETVSTMRAHVNEHVARCAIIGETSRAARVERLFSAGTASELRHFTRTEEDKAWAWLEAHEIK
jgi:hypothetical protein